MRILVTNDDGINSNNLKRLVLFAKSLGQVTCVAPVTEQSAKSHSLNIKKPFKYEKTKDIIEGVETYIVSSTPADCVRVAYYYLKLEFDLVLSGINNGYNLGEDILYSGTIGGASEGVLIGKKAIAFSTKKDNDDFDLSPILKVFKDKNLLDLANLWNVNIPPKAKGVKFAVQGHTIYTGSYCEEEKGIIKSVGVLDFSKNNHAEDTDVYMISKDYTTITPLVVDRTDYKILSMIKSE